MAIYSLQLADQIRTHLEQFPKLIVEKKKMFRGLTFMVNGKMCLTVSGENLMCRFDPVKQDEVERKKGFLPMIMKGKKYTGYCYVSPNGFAGKEFDYWMALCLDFNEKAKSYKKKQK